MLTLLLVSFFLVDWTWGLVALASAPRRPRLRRSVIATGTGMTITVAALVAWGALNHLPEAPGQAVVGVVAIAASVLWIRGRYGLAALCWSLLSVLAAWPLGPAGPIVTVPLAVGMGAVALSALPDASHRELMGAQ